MRQLLYDFSTNYTFQHKKNFMSFNIYLWIDNVIHFFNLFENLGNFANSTTCFGAA